MHLSDSDKTALVEISASLWIAIGIGVLFGFWWGFTAFPIALIVIARTSDV